MALVVPLASSDRLLGWLVNTQNSNNLKIKLFTNAHTVASGTTESDLTEATYSGYASLTLTRGSFTIAQSGGKSVATYADKVFGPASSGSQVIKGYYVTDSADNLLWAENFSDQTIDTSTTLTIVPKVSLDSEA
mgnify:CR=1 FL=1